ncbi:L,D-transpeptidase family protein [Roseomonas sp. CAU 1739]|uniref:L,D-transpeptidase family protein n=1 Tax=Roseomonas sp. CAU 1739 TaxID=3140364 RepID=UPI00325BF5A8
MTAPLFRRTAITGGPIALAAALSACSSTPPPRTSATQRPPPADNRLRNLRDAPEVIVAGEKLDADLLKRFYARHDFDWVWTTRPAQAEALTQAVLRAGDHGLDPELFHASLLQRRSSFPTLRRELLLSHALLTYAQTLSAGAMPADRRKDAEALTPDSIDIPAALDTIIASPDPAAALEALAPSTPTYLALRQALRRYRSGNPPAGIIPTLSNALFRGNPRFRAPPPPRITIADRIRTIEVNLERQRWLPRPLPADRAWVNVADQRLVLYRDDEAVFSTKVIVGDIAPVNQSPEFHTKIEASFFNPPWVIPADIVTAEYLPRLTRDPTYLERNNMVLRDNGEVEQRPGPTAGLGLVMFDMPNRFDVYLHDTPDRHLFNRDNRRLSHGCIRVQNPVEFAALLMEQPIEAINEGIALGSTTRNSLPTPVPVFVTYQTAFADAAGGVEFRPDFYGRDGDVWQRMQRQPEGRNAPADGRPGSAGRVS